MKNKSLKLRLSYFFGQSKQLDGKALSENRPDLVKPEADRTESIVEDILRWADDGGQMLAENSQGKPGNSSRTGKDMMNKKVEEEIFSKP